MAQAVNASMRRMSAAIFSSGLVKHYRKSTKSILELATELAAHCSENVPETQLKLVLVNLDTEDGLYFEKLGMSISEEHLSQSR